MNFIINKATRKDVPIILEFIRALADYEQAPNDVIATEALLEEWIFKKEKAEVLIGRVNGNPVAFALFHHTFPAYLGRAGIFLEALYVLSDYRGLGYGKMILQKLAQITIDRECGRLEWACLNWNAPSIAFYNSIGATPMTDLTTYRLTGDALENIGKRQTIL